MNALRRLLHGASGFSVVELSAGLTLAAIAATVTFGIFSSTQNGSTHSHQIAESQADIRVVANMMAGELRAAGNNPSSDDPGCPGFEPIPIATASSIQFRSDHDGDCTIDASAELAEEIMYSWAADSRELYRVTGSGWHVLMADVEHFSIRYFAADGREFNPPLDFAQRRMLRSLQIDVSVRGADGELRSWSATTGFRNDLQI